MAARGPALELFGSSRKPPQSPPDASGPAAPPALGTSIEDLVRGSSYKQLLRSPPGAGAPGGGLPADGSALEIVQGSSRKHLLAPPPPDAPGPDALPLGGSAVWRNPESPLSRGQQGGGQGPTSYI
jgi:hypothetical protein